MLRTDTTHSAVEVLSTVPYFAELAPEYPAIVEALARGAIRQEYEPGQVIFIEGEPCVGLYLVQSGWVKSIKMSPAGREQIVCVVGPNDVFNMVGVLSESAQNLATVIALEPAQVWLIRREVLLHALGQCPRLARIVTQHLVERAQHLMALVEDLSLRTVEARLARLLLDQSTVGMVHRQRWATQVEMSAQLGTVPDMINRVLQSLAQGGLIKVERRQIHILDCLGLERKARGEE